MKKTNKILSVILAIVMIFSVSPMAFAAECPHENIKFVKDFELIEDSWTDIEPETPEEVFLYSIDMFKYFYGEYSDAVYECDDCGEEITFKRADYSEYESLLFNLYLIDRAAIDGDIKFKEGFDYGEAFENVFSGIDIYSILLFTCPEGAEESLAQVAEGISEFIALVEENTEYSLIPIMLVNCRIDLIIHIYGEDKISSLAEVIEPKYAERADELMKNAPDEPNEEFVDAYIALMTELINEIEACASGKHGEIIDGKVNNGAMTGTCSSCEQEVTVELDIEDCKLCGEEHKSVLEEIKCLIEYLVELIKSLFEYMK